MRRYAITLLLLCIFHLAQGQLVPAEQFFLSLAKEIPINKNKPIILKVINYGCLGSEIRWSAELRNIGSLIRVSFYSQNLKDRTSLSTKLETVLDTTYTVERSLLQKNLEAEVTKIKSRPVYIEASFKILMEQEKSSKEFLLRGGEGLYYLLRFNRPWESYFARR